MNTQLNMTIDALMNCAKQAKTSHDERVESANNDLARELKYLYMLGVAAGLIYPGDIPPWVKTFSLSDIPTDEP